MYAPRAMLAATPERLARRRHPERFATRAISAHGALRVRHVLEHLDRSRHVELAIRERQVGRVLDAVLQVRPLTLRPLGLQLRVIEVDPDDPAAANPVVRRLMKGFESTLEELWQQAAPESILDVGCGEGV